MVMISLKSTWLLFVDCPVFWNSVPQSRCYVIIRMAGPQNENRSGTKWHRYKNSPFSSFEGDGYYLGDAFWLAQYRDDLTPPPERRWQNQKVDYSVRLVFRFAKENAKMHRRPVNESGSE
jgi:hypothetical protein